MIDEKTKKEILRLNGYDEFVGYCFDTPPADDEGFKTFVDKEEVFKVLEQGVQTYFWNNSHEQLFDLEQAWEYYEEDFFDNFDQDKFDWTPENIDKVILAEYEKKKKVSDETRN
jgi:hypothetical protein